MVVGSLWARLSAGFREDTYMYIGRVDKEEPEVVKWIWPSLEKEINSRIHRFGTECPLMSGRCGDGKRHPCLVWCAGLCFKWVD